MISRATLADELLFQSLPIEVQEAVKRLFPVENEYTAEYVDEVEIESYRQGWNDAVKHYGVDNGAEL